MMQKTSTLLVRLLTLGTFMVLGSSIHSAVFSRGSAFLRQMYPKTNQVLLQQWQLAKQVAQERSAALAAQAKIQAQKAAERIIAPYVTGEIPVTTGLGITGHVSEVLGVSDFLRALYLRSAQRASAQALQESRFYTALAGLYALSSRS